MEAPADSSGAFLLPIDLITIGMGEHENLQEGTQDKGDSMKSPKVSVIIPFYNRKRHVKECLNSVLSSSLKQIEVICVDDGSTDGTAELLDKLAAKDSRIVLIKKDKHEGAYQARWYGLMHAIGEYVHFMDSDDLVDSEAYEELYGIAKVNNLDQLVFTAESFNAEKHTPSEKKVKDGFDKHYHLSEECCGKVMGGKELFDSLCRHKSFFVGFPMRILRRDMIQGRVIPQCNAIWHADNFYSVVWMYWSNRAMAIDRKFYKRRVHRASITMKKDEEATHFSCILSVIMAFCGIKEFVERGCQKGTAEYDYVFRLMRGLNKRRVKIPAEKAMQIVESTYVWGGLGATVPFVQMCFIQLLDRFLH